MAEAEKSIGHFVLWHGDPLRFIFIQPQFHSNVINFLPWFVFLWDEEDKRKVHRISIGWLNVGLHIGIKHGLGLAIEFYAPTNV